MKCLNYTKFLLVTLILALLSPVLLVSAAEGNPAEISAGCNLSPGESKNVIFSLWNEDSVSHTYKLSVQGYANQYEMYFSSEGLAVNEAAVPAGNVRQVDLVIKLAGNAIYKDDQMLVKAVREDGKENTMNLSVSASRDYGISISSMAGRLDAISGNPAEIRLSVTNTGSKELNGISIKSELPYKWFVSEGGNGQINLKPGETGTYAIKIEVPGSQAAGNFTVKFTAVSESAASEQISIPVTVKTNSKIGYWMIGAVLALAVFTLVQFKRHGRR